MRLTHGTVINHCQFTKFHKDVTAVTWIDVERYGQYLACGPCADYHAQGGGDILVDLREHRIVVCPFCAKEYYSDQPEHWGHNHCIAVLPSPAVIQ